MKKMLMFIWGAATTTAWFLHPYDGNGLFLAVAIVSSVGAVIAAMFIVVRDWDRWDSVEK